MPALPALSMRLCGLHLTTARLVELGAGSEDVFPPKMSPRADGLLLMAGSKRFHSLGVQSSLSALSDVGTLWLSSRVASCLLEGHHSATEVGLEGTSRDVPAGCSGETLGGNVPP